VGQATTLPTKDFNSYTLDVFRRGRARERVELAFNAFQIIEKFFERHEILLAIGM
jgi:hypothetical protein